MWSLSAWPPFSLAMGAHHPYLLLAPILTGNGGSPPKFNVTECLAPILIGNGGSQPYLDSLSAWPPFSLAMGAHHPYLLLNPIHTDNGGSPPIFSINRVLGPHSQANRGIRQLDRGFYGAGFPPPGWKLRSSRQTNCLCRDTRTRSHSHKGPPQAPKRGSRHISGILDGFTCIFFDFCPFLKKKIWLCPECTH